MIEPPKLIITHDGLFHLDELASIALIFTIFGTRPVERRRLVKPEEFLDPEMWVLDQGSKYQPDLHNFDHHQDRTLSATNVLVLDYLNGLGLVDKELYLLLRRPFQGISDYDTKGPINFNGFQASELFKPINNFGEEGFGLALSVAMMWIGGLMKFADKKAHALEVFKKGESIEGIIRIVSEYPIMWPQMGTEKLLIAPERDQFRLHSSDTEAYSIISTGKEIFIHSNRFISTYHTLEDAKEAALLTSRLHSITPIL